MTLFDSLLGEFAGNFIVLGLLAFLVIIFLLLVLGLSKIMFLSIIIIALYALAQSGLVPMWVFALSLVPVGIFIGKMMLNAFFGSR